jgi:hypothetical protein
MDSPSRTANRFSKAGTSGEGPAQTRRHPQPEAAASLLGVQIRDADQVRGVNSPGPGGGVGAARCRARAGEVPQQEELLDMTESAARDFYLVRVNGAQAGPLQRRGDHTERPGRRQ